MQPIGQVGTLQAIVAFRCRAPPPGNETGEIRVAGTVRGQHHQAQAVDELTTLMLQGIMGDVILRPWFDRVALPSVARVYMPLSRAWVEALVQALCRLAACQRRLGRIDLAVDALTEAHHAARRAELPYEQARTDISRAALHLALGDLEQVGQLLGRNRVALHFGARTDLKLSYREVMAQPFIRRNTMVTNIYRMKTGSQFVNTLQDAIRE